MFGCTLYGSVISYPRAHAESRKEYDVNVTYTSKIQRQLSVYAEFTGTMYIRIYVPPGYATQPVDQPAAG